MLVEYPTSLEREMQTKKSHEIPEYEWGQTPDLQDWINKALETREAEKKKIDGYNHDTKILDIFSTFKPANFDYKEQFAKAKYKVLRDIGVNDNLIVAGLDVGDLVVEFNDSAISIDPHDNGGIVDYHEFEYHTLLDLSVYTPTSAGLQSCLFNFVCNNRTFEFLIRPSLSARTLEFNLTFHPLGVTYA